MSIQDDWQAVASILKDSPEEAAFDRIMAWAHNNETELDVLMMRVRAILEGWKAAQKILGGMAPP